MIARLQHRASPSRTSRASARAKSHATPEFERIRQNLDGYLGKAVDARKRLLEQPYDPKQLHAWRVSLRRVTATLNSVTHLSDDGLDDVVCHLRACREATGHCRDVDILAQETLPAFLRECPVIPPPAAMMQQAVAELQGRAHALAIASLKKTSLAIPVQSWRHWAAAIDPPSDRRIRENAAAVIDDRFNAVKKRIAKLNGGRKRLHRLRAAIKKLRYSMELYQHLFPKRAASAWLKQLADLQAHLGRAHDRLMGRDLVATLPLADDDQDPVKAFRRWARKSAYDASSKMTQSLTKLDKLSHYWRKAP
ncbi:CHAD domain-containing protein [Dyella humicola]|uniref:CHAD domain-containing protein n=1 Tax=Dyella humicola TaxID=2992126 RepID=UPI002253AFCA|nr:CHAD domain-containing protein [Dyella humicola]